MPECRIWFRLMRFMVRHDPYHSTWLERKMTVSPVVSSVKDVDALSIVVFVRG